MESLTHAHQQDHPLTFGREGAKGQLGIGDMRRSNKPQGFQQTTPEIGATITSGSAVPPPPHSQNGGFLFVWWQSGFEIQEGGRNAECRQSFLNLASSLSGLFQFPSRPFISPFFPLYFFSFPLASLRFPALTFNCLYWAARFPMPR